jgi:hypothetical protein
MPRQKKLDENGNPVNPTVELQGSARTARETRLAALKFEKLPTVKSRDAVIAALDAHMAEWRRENFGE